MQKGGLGLADAAIEDLKTALGGKGVSAVLGGFASMAALRVTGPRGEVLVTAADLGAGVVFLALAEGGRPYVDPSVELGTARQATAVAGIVQRRVCGHPGGIVARSRG